MIIQMNASRACVIVSLLAFSSMAVAGAALDDGISAVQSGRYAEALKILVPLANSGNDEAQRIVGEMCYNGQGMTRDVVASFKWNEIAAAGGNKIAQYNLGYLYEKGEGVDASRKLAIDWYTKAAIQGYVAAEHKLGDFYASSDREKSIYWYKKAGESGDEVARRNFSALSSNKVSELRDAERVYEAEKKEKDRQEIEDYRRETDRRAAQDAADRQSTREAWAAVGAQIRQRGADDLARLGEIDRQTNVALANSSRVLSAQASGVACPGGTCYSNAQTQGGMRGDSNPDADQTSSASTALAEDEEQKKPEQARKAGLGDSQKRHSCLSTITATGNAYLEADARSKIHMDSPGTTGVTVLGDPYKVISSQITCTKEATSINPEYKCVGKVIYDTSTIGPCGSSAPSDGISK